MHSFVSSCRVWESTGSAGRKQIRCGTYDADFDERYVTKSKIACCGGTGHSGGAIVFTATPRGSYSPMRDKTSPSCHHVRKS